MPLRFLRFSKLRKAATSTTGSFEQPETAKNMPSDGSSAPVDEESSRFGLNVLVPQPPAREGCVDIIAIHGLNGHYLATWTDRKTGANWLKDPQFLPDAIPNARIISFGYNSVTYFSRSNANVQDFASELLAAIKAIRTNAVEKRRPIIFICHSLGGIVFKQAVVRAHEQNRHYSDVLLNIKGVAFFGTPHQGSDLAFWDHIGTIILKAATMGFSTNATLPKDLRVDSYILKSISESFAYRGGKMQIFSFYETELMPGLNCRVVPRPSSILNWPNEIDVAAAANHSSICKFPTPHDHRYKTACNSIRQMIDETESADSITLTPEQESCLQDLNSDYEFHLSQVDDPVPGTCGWVLEHEDFLRWDSAQDSSLLWITADAGCGKSVIAKFLINYFTSRSKASLRNICYFFFKDGLQRQDNSQSALSAILHQIYCSQPALLHHAVAKHATMSKSSFRQYACLYSILMSTIDDEVFRETVCILDGLDECERKSRELLVNDIAHYYNTYSNPESSGKGWLKMVILSKPDNLIQRRLQLFSNHHMQEDKSNLLERGKQRKYRLVAENEAVTIADDVNRFIHAKIEDFGPKSEFSGDFLAHMESRLVSGADYTFLWVSLVIKLLEDAETDGVSREQIESILTTTNLDDLYSRLLSGRKNPLKTRKVLYVLLAATRPLTLEEMCVAVEFHEDYHWQWQRSMLPSTYSYGPSHSYGSAVDLEALEGRFCRPFENHLRLLCGHFLRIRANRVYLVHQTARKFLLDTRPSKFSVGFCLLPYGWRLERLSPAEITHLEKKVSSTVKLDTWKHSIRSDVANRYFLQICVEYITLFNSIREWASEAKMSVPKYIKQNQRQPAWRFLDYASVYWVGHYREPRRSLGYCFDHMFDPTQIRFPVWTSRYRVHHREDLDLNLVGRPINAESYLLDYPKPNKDAQEEQKDEFQRILDCFNLGGADTELWDEENLDGDHYWKEKSEDEGGKSELNSESPDEDRLRDYIPDRIQHIRRKHRNEVQENIRESSNPSNPTSLTVIDSYFLRHMHTDPMGPQHEQSVSLESKDALSVHKKKRGHKNPGPAVTIWKKRDSAASREVSTSQNSHGRLQEAFPNSRKDRAALNEEDLGLQAGETEDLADPFWDKSWYETERDVPL